MDRDGASPVTGLLSCRSEHPDKSGPVPLVSIYRTIYRGFIGYPLGLAPPEKLNDPMSVGDRVETRGENSDFLWHVASFLAEKPAPWQRSSRGVLVALFELAPYRRQFFACLDTPWREFGSRVRLDQLGQVTPLYPPRQLCGAAPFFVGNIDLDARLF